MRCVSQLGQIGFAPAIALAGLAMLVACNPASEAVEPPTETSDASDQSYQPSDVQLRVDRSFSAIAIDTPFAETSGKLTEIPEVGCAEWGECDWADENGVRHYFAGFEPGEYFLTVKSVRTEEFAGRPISALGIGMARRRDEVLANVRAFLSEVALDCGTIANQCSATLEPGWIRLFFDEKGQLTEARFDGNYFT